MRMGVVADDITGSNDIGIMFAKAGLLTHVYAYQAEQPAWRSMLAAHTPDICIIDTNSRLDPPETAYRKVFETTRELQAAGCTQFHNKTCSVFRGNIGVEFDAMLDALGQKFAVVVLGFPKNGRHTIHGVHYVHGKKLEESEFRHDPVHPMHRSDLVGILQAQTRRSVGLIDHTVIAQGPDALRAALDAARARLNYAILDVIDQEALAIIARAVRDEPVLCGSSALAEELPAAWGDPSPVRSENRLARVAGLGILCAAGSLMPQTVAQVEHLRRRGVPTFELDPQALFEESQRTAMLGALVGDVAQVLTGGADVVLHTAHAPNAVTAARAEGVRRGLDGMAVARLVSESLAEVVGQIIAQTGQNRVLVAGGETSGAVCAHLQIAGMRVWKEIQPGLPSCITLTTPPLLLVLKSGSFGSPDFFEQAIDHLKAE